MYKITLEISKYTEYSKSNEGKKQKKIPDYVIA
jgi:hypothetical protein